MGGPAHAQPVDDLQRADSLAQSIAWRLTTANAAFCVHAAPATGIVLEDAAVYADPALARSTYRLSGDIYVGALAGPGADSGLAVNTALAAINAQPLAALPAPSRQDPFSRLRRAQTMLDDAAARDGMVNLTSVEGRTVRIAAVPACRVAVRIDDGKAYANATRDEIRLGRRQFDRAQGDAAVIAAMIAHELAHAVLDHQSAVEASHGATAVIRRTEREADRLSVWLMANAGYPPEAAVRFQQTIIAHFAGPLAIDPTHGPWRERARVIAEEIATMRAAPDLDWAHRFRRESRT